VVAVSRPRYEVTAQRDGRWWFVRVAEVPGAATQARRLDQVEAMAREVREQRLTVADVGALLGGSFPRASQLLEQRAS